MWLDIHPHEDISKIAGLFVIVLICGALMALGKLSSEAFIPLLTLMAGYFLGRVRGGKLPTPRRAT